MNPHLFLDAFGSIDTHYIVKAEAVMDSSTPTKTHKNRHLRYLLIAATLTLILAAILLPIALGKDRTTTPDITTSIPTTTEKTYASLTDIPGATKLVSMESATIMNFDSLIEFDQQKWVENIKNHYSVFVGKLIDVEAVFLDEGDTRYVISVLTYQVYESIYNFEKTDTIKTVYVSEYRRDDSFDTVRYRIESTYSPHEGISVKKDMLYDAMMFSEQHIHENDNRVLCVLESSDQKSFSFGNTTYDLSAYAPYHFNAVLLYLSPFDASTKVNAQSQRLPLDGLYDVPEDDFYGPEPDLTPVDKSNWPKLNLIDSRH